MKISDRDKAVAQVALLSITLAAIVRTAWLSDTSINTLRSAVNFVHGIGPVVHEGERVQSFVHPLWFLLLVAGTWITGNAFAAAFGLSIVLSIVTVWLLIDRVASTFWSGMIAGLALLLSKAYIDYSTSGLETPLAHFLLVLGALLGLSSLESERGERLATASVTLLGLAYLCRPELVAAAVPFALLVLWRSYDTPLRTTKQLIIAILPSLCWIIFSKYYYRASIPPQVFARLDGANLSMGIRIRQGMIYLLDSLSIDPLTLTLIAIAILLSIEGSLELRALAAGVVLYLLYVVSVGGDSMSGHLLTIPLLASVIVISRSELSGIGNSGIALLILFLGIFSAPATIFAIPGNATVIHGIRDERAANYGHLGLVNFTRMSLKQPAEWTRWNDDL